MSKFTDALKHFTGRAKDAPAPKEVVHQPTVAERREIVRDLVSGLSNDFEHKAQRQSTAAKLEQREFKDFHREFEDRVDRWPAPSHQPTVAELREHGTHEPAWVGAASAYHRSRDMGDLGEVAPKEVAAPELGADDHEMGM